MKLVYFSLTNQVYRFVKNLGFSETALRLDPNQGLPEMTENFVFIIPTYEGLDFLEDFVEDNQDFCQGIIASGNLNFGRDYCHLAKHLCRLYHLPLLHTFEFSGNDQDIDYVKGLLTHES